MSLPRRPTPSRVTILLLLLLLAVNVAAVWGLVHARRTARSLAIEDLVLQNRSHALALEASLASLRGDLIYLAQAPPVSRAPELFAAADPVARRWGRLEVEGALLLFLEAHPAVRRLVIWGREREPLAVAGRQGGVAKLLPVRSSVTALREDAAAPGLVATRWPLAPSPRPGSIADLPAAATGQLEAWVDVEAVLARVVPGLEGKAALVLAGEGVDRVEVDGGWVVARARVEEAGFAPPIAFGLERRERITAVVGSLEGLTGLFGTTLVINLVVVTVTFALALLAFRQVRRAARLSVERKLEQKIQQQERLASVGRLAAGMAHEINNPLEGMSGYLALLEEDLAAGRVDEAPELAAHLRSGLERIAGITRQVLAYASPERSLRERVELGSLARGNISFLRESPTFTGGEIRCTSPDAGVWVEGNATALHQLVLNLLLNAVQMSRREGDVEKEGDVEVEVAQRGDRALLSVGDRGPGLSAEAQRHAFEPFFSTRGGTGLGLAVCRGIVEDHGGEIRARNRPRGGAVFTVSLPIAPPPPSEEDRDDA